MNDSIAGIALSHPDKLLFPKAKITKVGLAEYYHRHSQWALPHLSNRPLAILRCPQGAGEACFYQKHIETLPDTIGSVMVDEKTGHNMAHIVIKNEQSLISLVQFGALELHTWGSLADNIDKPDRIIFDLDPGKGVSFKDLTEAAMVLKAGLETMQLQSFVKTSGKKGLHVCVPLKRVHTWDKVKNFSKMIAEKMVEIAPDKYVATITKSERKGKILIDYLRNQRGSTCVAAYSTRATDTASISTPLSWDELESIKSSDQFTLSNIDKRLSKLKADPWEKYFTVKQVL